jgi:hypothetical protein
VFARIRGAPVAIEVQRSVLSVGEIRTPSAGPLVDLVRDFRPRVLPPIAGGTVDVPQRRLFVDRRPRWWQGVRPE